MLRPPHLPHFSFPSWCSSSPPAAIPLISPVLSDSGSSVLTRCTSISNFLLSHTIAITEALAPTSTPLVWPSEIYAQPSSVSSIWKEDSFGHCAISGRSNGDEAQSHHAYCTRSVLLRPKHHSLAVNAVSRLGTIHVPTNKAASISDSTTTGRQRKHLSDYFRLV